jgi:hypothetical protein
VFQVAAKQKSPDKKVVTNRPHGVTSDDPVEKMTAQGQAASIKKWAGKIKSSGFSGRDHDKILYG